MTISSFLIHSKVTSARKSRAINALRKFTSDIKVIDCFDAQDLQASWIHNNHSINMDRWNEQVDVIQAILIDNFNSIRLKRSINNGAGYVSLIKSQNYSESPRLEWLNYRPLNPGEISVNMKHYYAISSIAMGHGSYGLIAEDDVIENNDFNTDTFAEMMASIMSSKIDYVDLAGGCKLFTDSPQSDNKLFQLVSPPRTRTNAAYIISKRLAKIFANNFLPFVLPIDWHLTYLMHKYLTNSISCAWMINHPLIHGSEVGAYKSWRS